MLIDYWGRSVAESEESSHSTGSISCVMSATRTRDHCSAIYCFRLRIPEPLICQSDSVEQSSDSNVHVSFRFQKWLRVTAACTILAPQVLYRVYATIVPFRVS